jgi:hypothetical protein
MRLCAGARFTVWRYRKKVTLICRRIDSARRCKYCTVVEQKKEKRISKFLNHFLSGNGEQMAAPGTNELENKGIFLAVEKETFLFDMCDIKLST